MNKIQLGGIKILKGRSRIESICENSGGELAGICYRLGAERINLSLLTHIANDGQGKSATALCTENANAFCGYFLAKSDARGVVELPHEVCILSVFPHERRPLITAVLLELIGREDVHPIGIASSPSAMSILAPCADTEKIVDGFFKIFEFPDYCSPLEWQAAYLGKEELFRDVVGSYEEQDLKVYAILDLPDLDLWTIRLSPGRVQQMGAALREADNLGVKMPFFVAHSCQDGDLILGLCLSASHRNDIQRLLDSHVPFAPHSSEDAAAVFLHGPHFGDRHRIANALTSSLQAAGIQPLALSCAVHSMSVILKSQDLRGGVQAISTRFHVPTGKS